jgi:hypothetical protein
MAFSMNATCSSTFMPMGPTNSTSIPNSLPAARAPALMTARIDSCIVVDNADLQLLAGLLCLPPGENRACDDDAKKNGKHPLEFHI